MFLQQFYEDSFYSYAKSREKFSIRERVYSNIYEENTYENNLMSDTSPLQNDKTCKKYMQNYQTSTVY